MRPASFQRLGVFGVGLMGGSIGARARAEGLEVVGYDVRPEVLQEAVNHGVIAKGVSREQLYASCDVVVIAAHLEPTLDELTRLQAEPQPQPGPGLIMDIGSVKGVVARAGQGVANFVASHPMAGTERSGPGAAWSGLFEGKTWVYVPSPDPELNQRARDFIELMGARPVSVEADEHDRVVAQTSHLPQMHASLYAQRLHQRDHQDLVAALCGPTGRELLRLSRSSYTMWKDIFAYNSVHVEAELRAQARALERAADALRANDLSSIEAAFRDCQSVARPI